VPVVQANPLKTGALTSARVRGAEVDAKILTHLLRSSVVVAGFG